MIISLCGGPFYNLVILRLKMFRILFPKGIFHRILKSGNSTENPYLVVNQLETLFLKKIIDRDIGLVTKHFKL